MPKRSQSLFFFFCSNTVPKQHLLESIAMRWAQYINSRSPWFGTFAIRTRDCLFQGRWYYSARPADGRRLHLTLAATSWALSDISNFSIFSAIHCQSACPI